MFCEFLPLKTPPSASFTAELRPGRGDISVFLGQNNAQGLNELLKTAPDQLNRSTIDKALVNHKSGVKYLLASNSPSDATLLGTADQMGDIVRELKDLANFVVLDLGVGLPQATQRALGYCDTVILVIEPDPHTMVQTKALLADLNALGAGGKILNTMLSRVRTDQAMTAIEVEQALGKKLDVVFTSAHELAYQAYRTKQPMVTLEPQSYTAKQTLKIVTLLTKPEEN